MRLEDLIFKTITLNREKNYANVFIHDIPWEVGNGYDDLETVALNLVSIGLETSDPKDQVFDGDIVELFDWGHDSSDKPIQIAEVYWDTQLLGWEYFVNPEDHRQFGDGEIDGHDKWRTNPKTINNKHIPEGYEIRIFYKL